MVVNDGMHPAANENPFCEDPVTNVIRSLYIPWHTCEVVGLANIVYSIIHRGELATSLFDHFCDRKGLEPLLE